MRMIIIIISRKSEDIRVHSPNMLQLTFRGCFFFKDKMGNLVFIDFKIFILPQGGDTPESASD